LRKRRCSRRARGPTRFRYDQGIGQGGESLDVTGRLVPGDELSEADLAACVGLLETAFPRWPSQEIEVPPAEYLRWKLEIPGPEAASVHLLEAGGELVAFATYLPRWYRVFGERYRVNDGVDAAVDPAWQGQGLYRRRRDLKSEQLDPDYDFTVVFSRNERVLTYRGRRGRAEDDGQPRVLRRFNRVWKTAAAGGARSWWERILATMAISGLRAWSWVRNRPVRFERGALASWDLREVERFDERVDELFERSLEQFDWIQERTAAWLNWRYTDPRNAMYRMAAAEAEGELLGYVVFRESRGHGYVLDLLAVPGRLDVAESLLDLATRELAVCEVVECWVTPGHPYERVVRGQGFVGPGRDTGMVTRSIAVDERLFEPVLRPSGRAHVMLGDSDWL